MCGIAGYLQLYGNNFTTDASLLTAINASLQHRGPDDAGWWIDTKRSIALLHRRLSIIDLSAAAAQPMHNSEQTIVISFNGEIYNFHEIKAELIALGHFFVSTSDTEVIVYAYQQWGISFLYKLEGDFAIALFDRIKNELFLIRDRMGVKPLYFAAQNGMLSFASEIKALWQMPWNEKRMQRDAISHYLTYLAVPAPLTLFEQVYKLPAGFYAKIDAQRELTFHEWYTLPIAKHQNQLENDVQQSVRALLTESVHKRMIADVPVGIFLSGGVDSSIIAAIGSHHTRHVKTFNISFSDGPELQERAWALAVARHCNTDHHEIIISEQEAFDFFKNMRYHADEPLGDTVGVPLFYISCAARKAGVKVVLIGEGADELFGGYTLYPQYLALEKKWKVSQRSIPTLVRKAAAWSVSKLYDAHKTKVDLADSWARGQESFYTSSLVFSRFFKPAVLLPFTCTHHVDSIVEKIYPGFPCACDSYAIANYHRDRLYAQCSDADMMTMMTYLELKNRLPDLLLPRTDKMTMAASIEARVPFLDTALVEYMLSVPTCYKIKDAQTKYILKKTFEHDVPYEALYRKKMGFSSPLLRWFKEGSYFANYCADMLATNHADINDFVHMPMISQMLADTKALKADYAPHLWALVNLFENA